MERSVGYMVLTGPEALKASTASPELASLLLLDRDKLDVLLLPLKLRLECFAVGSPARGPVDFAAAVSFAFFLPLFLVHVLESKPRSVFAEALPEVCPALVADWPLLALAGESAECFGSSLGDNSFFNPFNTCLPIFWSDAFFDSFVGADADFFGFLPALLWRSSSLGDSLTNVFCLASIGRATSYGMVTGMIWGVRPGAFASCCITTRSPRAAMHATPLSISLFFIGGYSCVPYGE